MTTCLVSLPPRAPFDEYYDKLLTRAITRAGLTPVRSDDLDRHRAVADRICSGVSDASVCILDLTGRSASVLYVMGLAHAMGKPVILLVQNIDDLPFDLRFSSYLLYRPGTAGWEDMLSLRLESAIRESAGVRS